MAFDRLVEEADYQNTSELFGGKQRGGRSLEGFIPKSEDDFLEYAELLVQKLRPFEVHKLLPLPWWYVERSCYHVHLKSGTSL